MKEALQYQTELDSIDWRTTLRRARRAVRDHVLLILTCCIVSVALLVAFLRIFPPVYQAEATVMGEANDDAIRGQYYAQWAVFRKGELKAEPELITSGLVARKVVTALNLRFNDVHHTFLTHAAYLWTESWLGRNYRALKERLFPPDPSAYVATEEEKEMGRTVDAFKDGVSVESVPGTAVARVIVKAPTYRAAEIANKVVEVYLGERSALFMNEAEMAFASLEQEVWRASADLIALDKQKLEFETRNKVVLDFEKDKLLVANWVAMQSSVSELKTSISSLEASLKVTDEQLAHEPREITQARTLQDSTVKGMLQSRLFQLSTSLQLDRERYQSQSPEVAQLEKFVADTKSALQQESEKVEVGQQRMVNPVHTELVQKRNGIVSQLASARAAITEKQVPLSRLEQRMEQMPTLVKAVLEHNRVRDGLEMRYKLLRDRMMQADVSRSTMRSVPASVRLIDRASTPMRPNWPKNYIMYPAALAAGLVIGLVLAVLAEVFSPRINRDRLASYPGFPLYAVVEMRPPAVRDDVRGASVAVARPVLERLRGAA